MEIKISVEELRQNALRSFAEQGRTVTVDDYTVRALAMPSQFGAIAKAYVTRELLANSDRSVLDKNPLALSLYVLAYDVDGKLTTASNTLKENLRKYLFFLGRGPMGPQIYDLSVLYL